MKFCYDNHVRKMKSAYISFYNFSLDRCRSRMRNLFLALWKELPNVVGESLNFNHTCTSPSSFTSTIWTKWCSHKRSSTDNVDMFSVKFSLSNKRKKPIKKQKLKKQIDIRWIWAQCDIKNGWARIRKRLKIATCLPNLLLWRHGKPLPNEIEPSWRLSKNISEVINLYVAVYRSRDLQVEFFQEYSI